MRDAVGRALGAELVLLARSTALADLVQERLLEPDVARSARGAPPSGRRHRVESGLWDRLAHHP